MDSTRSTSTVDVPPTTNELNPQEKAILLRKTRKLSRVFGEVPSSIQQASQFHPPVYGFGHTSSGSSSSSSHRRSVSSVSTVTSQASSKRRHVARKAPSQPNIRVSMLDEGDEPLETPKLPKSSSTSEADSSSSTATPGPVTGPISYEHINRIRLAKLRRRLGEDKLPPDVLSSAVRQSNRADDLQFRKSMDAVPLRRGHSRSSSLKPPLRRSRSTVPEVSAKSMPSVDDPVEFHRRYVQNFGCEGRVTQATRKDTQQLPLEQEPPQYVDVAPALPSKPSDTSDQQQLQQQHNFFSVAGAMEDNFVSPNAATESDDRDSVINISPDDPDQQSRAQAARTAFQERRRRAAKLAQFFGVGYHDLSGSLPISDLASHTSYRPSSQSSPAVQVDIAMKGRRFWGGGDERWTYKDADMVDVIDRLRDLRA
ncbi:hypothetical protein AAF712_001049 [Marasmius tenuissimus]|uniref:Uncharacterized protein n=1 Tax=Marasmius tenuissimus TaxID=585030 RepID=A0ABR3ADW4_9AGAR